MVENVERCGLYGRGTAVFSCLGGARRPRAPSASIACIPFTTGAVIFSAHYVETEAIFFWKWCGNEAMCMLWSPDHHIHSIWCFDDPS